MNWNTKLAARENEQNEFQEITSRFRSSGENKLSSKMKGELLHWKEIELWERRVKVFISPFHPSVLLSRTHSKESRSFDAGSCKFDL